MMSQGRGREGGRDRVTGDARASFKGSKSGGYALFAEGWGLLPQWDVVQLSCHPPPGGSVLHS